VCLKRGIGPYSCKKEKRMGMPAEFKSVENRPSLYLSRLKTSPPIGGKEKSQTEILLQNNSKYLAQERKAGL
jgi:hypothetical protein